MDAIALAIPFFFLLMGVELAWSVWSGAKEKRIYRFNDFISNMGCGIGSQVVGAFTKALIFAVYLWVYEHARLFTLPDTPLTWIVTFLLIDLLYYWFHRLSHEVNFLWAAHIVHHQSEEYNLSVALRQSWWQGLFSFWFYVPVAFLGVHPVIILTVGAFVTLYQFWIHTRAIGRMGFLELILNTPSNHRVHHGSDPKYIDRNHAGTLIIWDKLFGTFQREEEEPVYGITTPLASWDPVKANFHYWADLFALARSCDRWQDKVMTFLHRPGWRPASLGGPEVPKEIDRSVYRKYDTRVPGAVVRYVAIQFILLIAATTGFLFGQQHLTQAHGIGAALIILIWVMTLGLLMEGRRWAVIVEALRIVALVVLLLVIGVPLFGPLVMWAAVLLGVVSTVHLVLVSRALRSVEGMIG
ncbi:MAG: sterol desaturase family protein [Flavobacteriales bacterium]|nr:sterol desaturase family protein [Flavobacteriales bacterium]